jgi:hypothetical protein
MTKKKTTVPVVDQVMSCIAQYEQVGASASEVADEILLPVRMVHDHICSLADAGRLRATNILRPWKHNPSEGQVPIRKVYVAMQHREA